MNNEYSPETSFIAIIDHLLEKVPFDEFNVQSRDMIIDSYNPLLKKIGILSVSSIKIIKNNYLPPIDDESSIDNEYGISSSDYFAIFTSTSSNIGHLVTEFALLTEPMPGFTVRTNLFFNDGILLDPISSESTPEDILRTIQEIDSVQIDYNEDPERFDATIQYLSTLYED